MSITRAHFVRANGAPSLRSVVGEVCEGRRGGGLSWHRSGRFLSTAAAASGDAERYQRSGKRISKKERRTMVVAFVNKYRALNAGKFPTASVTKQEVGGNYYTIREILQEVKFNFVHNPVGEISMNPLVEKGGVEKEIIPEISESRGQSLVDSEMERSSTNHKLSCDENTRRSFDEHTNHCISHEKYSTNRKMSEIASSSEKTLLEEASRSMSEENKDDLTSIRRPECDSGVPRAERPPVMVDEKNVRSTPKRIDYPKKVVMSPSKPVDQRKVVMSPSKPVDQRKDVKSASESIDDLRVSGSDESRKSSTADHSDPQQKPSLWSNLKSIADSVFGIWKKK